jgi:hypothetical protein
MRLYLIPLLGLAACVEPAPEAVTHTVANATCEGAGELLTVAGALRNDGKGWQVISDTEHSPLNIAEVTTKDGMIEVTYTFKAERVISLIAAPDEALARNGYGAGASVGLDKARISLAKGGAVDPWRVSTKEVPWSNLWVYGVFKGQCG